MTRQENREGTFPKPPVQIEPFVRVLGPDRAATFLLEFGGAELYLTANPKGRSRLAELFDVETAAEIARAAEHLPRRIPTAKPWLALLMHSRDLPIAEIARKLHVTDVTVRSYLKAANTRSSDPPSRQMNLPGL
ncbi:RNA polymerase sigma factor sigma-70 region 4 domain-containing protein [Chachezhania sediminis]|uniref:HTH domain-containing protein n=1 Tax=Chachezhania sediminis TaxID=2599291 RepID=UPI00131B8481|nr:HTH domain-containing protein [Chachezhania sediminis]